MEAQIERIIQKMKRNNIQKNTALSMKDIKCFEQSANIKLPKELVLFYTEVCNGCKMLDGFNLLRMDEWIFNADNLRRDFPFERYWIWEDECDHVNKGLKDIENGNLLLIDIGDAQSWHIIVQGKERGKMWFFTDVGIQPCAPAMNFLEWFEFWLDGHDDYFYEFK